MSTPQVPQLALTLRRLPRRGRAESFTTRDRLERTERAAGYALDGRTHFRTCHTLRSLRTLHQVDLEKPPQVSDRVQREVSRPDNVRDDPLAPPHVSYGRETLKPPQVRARVVVGTMPVGELECGRRAGALGGRARVGLDSEPDPRVLGLESARGGGRSPAHTRF